MNDIEEVKEWLAVEVSKLNHLNRKNSNKMVAAQIFGAQCVLSNLYQALRGSNDKPIYPQVVEENLQDASY